MWSDSPGETMRDDARSADRGRRDARANKLPRLGRSEDGRRLTWRWRRQVAMGAPHEEATAVAAAESSGGAAEEEPGAMQERATDSKRRSISGAQRVKFLDQKL